MNELVHFVAKAEGEAGENLRDFVALCRDQLTVFGNVSWDDRTWDISETIPKKGGSGRNALVWEDLDGAPLPQSFGDFARAYMRYQHGVRPSTAITFRMAALRCFERCLRQRTSSDVTKATAADLNQAAGIIQERFQPDAAYRVGAQLQIIGEFIDQHRLSAARIHWTNTIKRPQSKNNRVGSEADQARSEKLPSERALESLGRAFAVADDPKDVLVTSVGALLCSAPDRINEVLRLPLACQHHDVDSEGNPIFGIRWWPSKGADPYIKWVVGTMSTVAQEAIEKVTRLTDEARAIARWYEENPTELYLPTGHEELRNRDFVRAVDLVPLLGVSGQNAARQWLRDAGVPFYKSGARAFVRFADFEAAVLETLPVGFPVFDREVGIKFSESLFIVPKNFFHMQRGTSRVMVEAVDWGDISNGLGAGVKHGKTSVFSQLGFTEDDGSPIIITTHQIRHWLNTVAQRNNLSQLDIAKWSGRKDVRQNEVYDHVSGDEVMERIRDLEQSSFHGPLADFIAQTPLTRQEFMALEFPAAAHTTDLGFCIHDFAQTPCQRHRDCVNCTEHVCVKGDEAKTERIRQRLEETETLLAKAEEELEDGSCGADRWVEHQRATIERLQSLVEIMDDPSVPSGAVIQLSNDRAYSPIRIATEQRALAEDDEGKMIARMRALAEGKK